MKCIFLLAVFTVPGIFLSDAYAYIDPGSGSIVIQMLIGALVGVGITAKVYWHKIKFKIQDKFSKQSNE